MSTIAEIAASYGIEHYQLAHLVGMGQLDPHSELSAEQVDFILDVADNSDEFGSNQSGRHRH